MNSLTAKALASLIRHLFLLGLLLFLSAGSLDFWEAWLLLPPFFISHLLMASYLLRKDPDLLKRRLRGGPRAENRTRQKLIISLMSLGFALLVLVSGLD